MIWSSQSLPKVKKFLWQCSVEAAIPTKRSLRLKKCYDSPLCPICLEEVETIEHMLLLCPWAMEVWSLCPLDIHIRRERIYRIEQWMLETLDACRGEEVEAQNCGTIFSFLCWNIWKARNAWVFENILPCLSSIVSKSLMNAIEFLANSASLLKSLVHRFQYDPPMFGWLLVQGQSR